MKVIRILLVGLLYVAVSTNIKAQKGDKKKQAQQEMVQQLELSKEQQKSLHAINKKYQDQIQVIKKDASIEKADQKSKIKALKLAKQEEIQAILTKEQYLNYQELEAKKSQKAKTSKKDKGAKLAEELNLTEEQATKVEAIYQTYNPQIKSLKANKTLSEEDKTAQIKALKDKKKNELKEVLTADQYKKMKALKKDKKKKK